MFDIFNANLLRTLLTIGAIVFPALVVLFGCTSGADGTIVVCSAPWLTPQVATLVSTAMLLLNLALKAFQGGVPGTGLVAPTVPVVNKVQPGTVTPADVARPK